MSRLLPTLLIVFAAGLAQADERPELAEGKTLEVKLVAYYEGESDQTRYGRKNAIGTELRAETDYTSAAADWSIFPLGTKFRIEGGDTTYVVDDCGSGLVGKVMLDLYVSSHADMKRFNARTATVEILELGSFEKSRKILSGRLKHKHCATMHDAIEKHLAE